MNTKVEYRVLPAEPKHEQVSLTLEQKKSTKGLGGDKGCLLWAGIFLACYFGIGYMAVAVAGGGEDVLFFAAFAVGVIIASVAVIIVARRVKRKKIDEWELEINERARQAVANRIASEATSLTSTVANSFQSSKVLATELTEHLDEASAWLQDAETEYDANAYGPFWDAVENAALHLSEFNNKAKQLAGNADNYYENLNGRKHNFPPFPIQPNRIPDAAAIITEMRRIVRMGQTNFQFANIWEHRQTREVLIAGFHTLGEAVSNLGSVIDNSIYGLQQSVSSDVAKLVEEQIRTRDRLDDRLIEQNRMLDNIQHHRKPEGA